LGNVIDGLDQGLLAMNLHQAATDAFAAKLAALGSGLITLLSWDSSNAIVGVPANVLLAAFTGALLGVAYGEPIVGRGRLFTATIVNAMLAGAFVGILLSISFVKFWLDKAPAAGIALITAFWFRWLIPWAVENRATIGRSFWRRLMQRLGFAEKGELP
jgi:hypothetical protein